MDGSQSINQRKALLKTCYKIIFNSAWSKKRFLEGLENKFVNSNKLLIFYQSAQKGKVSFLKKKKKWITFVGRGKGSQTWPECGFYGLNLNDTICKDFLAEFERVLQSN